MLADEYKCVCVHVLRGGWGEAARNEEKLFVTSSTALQMTLNMVVTKRQAISTTKTTQTYRISIYE
jgi:hypothetical protein